MPAPESPRLLERMRRRAGTDSALRFDAFMDLALYAPEVGYYGRPDRALGRAGDFYTASHVAPLFGWSIAERLLAAHRRAGAPPRFTVVELGGGDGTMAHDILERLGARLPAPAQWEYVLVEPSPSLRSRAEAAVRGSATASLGVRCVADGPWEVPFSGCVIANELLDALPVRRFRRAQGAWREIFVRVQTDAPEETLGSEAAVLSEAATLPDARDESTLELPLVAGALVRGLADTLARGEAILLDYGGPESDWTARSGPGTIRAYRGHAEPSDVYADPGSVDLSAFVNFDRVRAAARRAGLSEIAFQRQAQALGAWGFGELQSEWIARAADSQERVRRQLAAKSLLFGFENFWALELAVPGPAADH